MDGLLRRSAFRHEPLRQSRFYISAFSSGVVFWRMLWVSTLFLGIMAQSAKVTRFPHRIGETHLNRSVIGTLP